MTIAIEQRLENLIEFFRRFFARHSRGYWIRAFVILIVCVFATSYVERALDLEQARYWWYQKLTELEHRPLMPRDVKVVLIGDAEHWGPELNGITPTKRSYLAKLVDRLSQYNAKAIALDFDLRLPDPGLKVVPGDFSGISPDTLADVKTLIRSIGRAAAAGRKVVLSRSIAFGKNGGYVFAPDIYQAFGICLARKGDGWLNPGLPEFPLDARAQKNITCGYVALPYDMRLMPPRLYAGGGQEVDSFAFVLAQATKPHIAKAAIFDNSYGSYIPPHVLEENDALISANRLLSADPDIEEWVDGSAVIVGGQWHALGEDAGERTDTHLTPIGPVSGAVIHENFAEAILDSRVYGQVPEWTLHAAEILFSLIAIVAFSYFSSLWLELGLLAALCIALVFIQWTMLQIFGTFFEAFVPLIGLFLHALAENFAGHH